MKTMLDRGAGILMPVSSLPSPYGIGTFGKAAYEFVDFLKKARQKYWQVLPVGPTSYGDSPYQSFSAFAGNPYFIDLDTLVEEELLTREEIDACYWGDDEAQVAYDTVFWYRFPLLKKAHARSEFYEEEGYEKFYMESWYWLNDYAFYMALKFHFDNQEWLAWPEDIRFRKKDAVERYKEELKEEIDFWKFLQYKFFQQWKKLRAYANSQGISIIGDIPIYVALDSADVWTHPELFLLDEENLTPLKVAGVPPDAFSEDGQLWGNPLYRWDVQEKTDFAWWKERMKASGRLYDVVRIDHFIGVVQYYAIPAGAEDGKAGEWLKGPGKKLTDAIGRVIGDTIKMASGFCLEITVFTAMATLDMEFVSTYIVPVLIYTVILAVLTVPLIFYLAYRFCREEWFEKACMAFGAATGNTSTGLALVRAVDPDSLSSAGDTHGVYSAIMSWKDVFVGLTPIWLTSGIGLTCGVGFAMMFGFAAFGFIFFARKNKRTAA